MFPPVPSPVSHAESNARRRGVYRVNKESLKVLGLRTQLQGPGDLPLEDLVDGVHVVQVRPLGEQQLSPPRKQTLRTNGRTSVHSQDTSSPQKVHFCSTYREYRSSWILTNKYSRQTTGNCSAWILVRFTIYIISRIFVHIKSKRPLEDIYLSFINRTHFEDEVVLNKLVPVQKEDKNQSI